METFKANEKKTTQPSNIVKYKWNLSKSPTYTYTNLFIYLWLGTSIKKPEHT